jgi:prevent-host-death family protein
LELLMEVGIRELKNHLSRYLDRVRDGDEIVVTDRGRAIARVVPFGDERVLDRLVADGLVAPARREKQRATKPIAAKGSVSDLVVEQRR